MGRWMRGIIVTEFYKDGKIECYEVVVTYKTASNKRRVDNRKQLYKFFEEIDATKEEISNIAVKKTYK